MIFTALQYQQTSNNYILKNTKENKLKYNNQNSLLANSEINNNTQVEISNKQSDNIQANNLKEINVDHVNKSISKTQLQLQKPHKQIIQHIPKPIINTAFYDEKNSSHLTQEEYSFEKNNIQNISSTSLNKNEIIPFNTNQLINTNFLQKNISSTKKFYKPIKPIDCPGESSSYKKNWYIEAFLSPEYVTKKVSSLDPNSEYIKRKDSSERMIMGITLGAKVTRGLTKNIYVRAGLQYSNLIEKQSFRYESERKEITIITIRTETDVNGNTVTISDTTKQLQISYANNVRYNLYSNIELPISLGYEFYNRAFKASINGGVIVNLASWYQGKILDTSFQLISAKENSSIYKHNVGVSLFGSISLIKPLTDNFDIFAEPYFRYRLTDPKYNAYGFKQKFNAAGINLGVRFKLNHKARLSLNN
ncbi:MAG: hypothetical protein LC122_06290 [Chitinophagales bacterium]|nr:hypothetical protein [Chitinophagales bacterium]